MTPSVRVVVEGLTDEAVVRRLFVELRVALGASHVARRKAQLDGRLAGFNSAAKFGPWLVLRDLDRDEDCAPTLVRALLPAPAPHMRLRVAVRAVESWLLADAEAISGFLGVSRERVPASPDDLVDPKDTLVHLAASSRRSPIREMAPTPRSGTRVGPAYTDQIIEFVTMRWRPTEAANRSPSLRRTIAAIRNWGYNGLAVASP